MFRRISALSLLLYSVQAQAGEVTVTGSLFQSHITAPGDSIQGSVEVQNNTDELQNVLLYQTDYLYKADGSNIFGETGSHDRSNGGWVQLESEQIELQPTETRTIFYTVAVPDDETLFGTYWSVIMIEGGSFTDVENEEAEREIAIKTQFRYGVQVVNTLPGTSEVDLAIFDRRLEATETARVLEIDMINQGTRLSRPVVWAEIFTEDGISTGRLESERKRIHPGCSVQYAFDLSELGVGMYTALVVVDAGDDGVVGSQYTIELR